MSISILQTNKLGANVFLSALSPFGWYSLLANWLIAKRLVSTLYSDLPCSSCSPPWDPVTRDPLETLLFGGSPFRNTNHENYTRPFNALINLFSLCKFTWPPPVQITISHCPSIGMPLFGPHFRPPLCSIPLWLSNGGLFGAVAQKLSIIYSETQQMQQKLVKFHVVIFSVAGLLASDSVLCTVLTARVNGSLNYIILAS